MSSSSSGSAARLPAVPLPAEPHTSVIRTAVVRTAALIAVGAAATLALGACAPTDDDEGPRSAPTETVAAPPPLASYERYVALGDSFAALGPLSTPTTGPEKCLRSTRNYPALLAEHPRVGDLTDVTCGGAQIPDMTTPQIAETPAQFDALTPDVDLVTLSIGGNDIGFGDIVRCITSSPPAGAVAPVAPCRDRLEFEVTDALDMLGGQLDNVYEGIRQRSPDALVITTAYLPLIPAHGGCDFLSRMSPGDVTWARQVTQRINLIVTAAATRAGTVAVLPDDAADLHGCAAPAERYTDFTGLETGSHPMHPTAAGHRAMADAVAATF